MKKLLLLFFSLCLLFSGCGISGTDGTTAGASSGSAAVTSADTTATADTLDPGSSEPVTENVFLDNREAYDDSGALWHVPNAEIESLRSPTLYNFAGQLLVTSFNYISDVSTELTLTLMRASDSTTVRQVKYSLREEIKPLLLGRNIAICDNSSGTIILLDDALNETARFTLAPDPSTWYLGTDLDTLYKCSYFDGITACSVSSGQELPFPSLAQTAASGPQTGTDICFTGVDLQTLRCVCPILDLESGGLTMPPFEGNLTNANRVGEVWLAGDYDTWGVWYLGSDASPRVLTSDCGTFSLLSPTAHLLFTGYDGTLALYDADGTFISACVLPGQYVQSIVWQEALGGYLLTTTGGEGALRLLFWDISVNTDGEDLKTQSLADYLAVPGGTSADSALYDRAEKLSERFGVEILIADQCETDFPYFSCYPVSDSSGISGGLDLLENALSAFPEGFLSQLAHERVDRVQFQLVGGLTAVNGFGGDTSYAAFTDRNGSVVRIVLDLYSISTCSIWHELSHAIDMRLAWNASLFDDSLFSKEKWLSLQPDGFYYSEDYGVQRTDILPEWYSFFIDDYSMINSSEDRARIFENAMGNRHFYMICPD
ncbi:MAG: hypothetical protein ACI4XQ_02155, partial [Eubacteriales bacterium]